MSNEPGYHLQSLSQADVIRGSKCTQESKLGFRDFHKLRFNPHSIDVFGEMTHGYRQVLQVKAQMKAMGPDIGLRTFYESRTGGPMLMGKDDVLVCTKQKFHQNLVFDPQYLPELDLVFLAREGQGHPGDRLEADCYIVDPVNFNTVCKFKSLLSPADSKIHTVLALTQRRSARGIEELQLLIQYENLIVERVYLFNPNIG